MRDPTSDMAVLARRGSAALKQLRFKRERENSVKSLFELQGSRIGKIMGIKEEKEKDVQEVGDDGNVNYKESSQFAKHMKNKQAVSKFALTKTLKQQREFLPIFRCKKHLIKLISENPVLVVVGETGSGKTTQMTQYVYESGFGRRGLIACTQPRRVAAMSVAKRVR